MKKVNMYNSQKVIMKKLVLLVILLLLVKPAFAGVGIVYSTTRQAVNEETTSCVPYGIYNPWEQDATVILTASEEFSEFNPRSEETFVVAATSSKDALAVDLCFRIPEVYEEQCWFWRFGCEQTCNGEDIIYSGNVLASEQKALGGAGTGSSTIVSASAPLEIRIRCKEHARSWESLVALIGAVIIAIGGGIAWNRARHTTNIQKTKEHLRLWKRWQEWRQRRR